jgi:hypothetical protein
MTKFVPELKPCLMVFCFNFLEAWSVVFGPNQVWNRIGIDLDFFKFSRAHSSASFFLSLACLLKLCCRALMPPLVHAPSTQVLSPRSGRIAAVSTRDLPRCYSWSLPCVHVEALE